MATYCSDCANYIDDPLFSENGVCLRCELYYDMRIDTTACVNGILSYRTTCYNDTEDAKRYYGTRDKRILRINTPAGRAVYYCDPEMDKAPRLIFPSYAPDTLCREYYIDYIGIDRIVSFELEFQKTMVSALSGNLDTTYWEGEDFDYWNNQPEFFAHGIEV